MTRPARKPWTSAELDVLRRPITAAEMAPHLPGRSNQAIRIRRLQLSREEGFAPVNPKPNHAALGRASAASRRAKEAESRSRFMLAIEAGTKLTQNAVVHPRTYQKWAEKHPEFCAWLSHFRVDPVASRATKARRSLARAVPVGELHRSALLQNDLYRVASEAIGRGYHADAAISAMVLDLLEGVIAPEDCKLHARKYRGAASGEISNRGFEPKHDAVVSFRHWQREEDAA